MGEGVLSDVSIEPELHATSDAVLATLDRLRTLELEKRDLPVGSPRLVELAKLRWRIERDYHDLKQELGLDHFEGRSWRGFHHHATLCIAAYGFLISERETIPPSGPGPAGAGSKASLPAGYRPRGAPDPARATRSQLHRDTPPETRRRSRAQAAAMSMLLSDTPLMTQ